MLYKIVFLVVSVFMFFGCSSSPKPVDGSDEEFAKNAILIDYNTTKELNMYDSESHVIPLVVYQLNDINGFNTLKKDKAGIIKLLEGKKFDKSVMGVSKFFISSSKSKKLFLDRATKTVWVCLVAGYYDMQPSQSTLSYKIPEPSSWKFYESDEKQKFLKINVYFDKSSIEKRQE